mmetsp:Transcript_24770/g.36325  ORF Transcript_24770/g.36325 Transcript_24770/m.36325 type:complete len:219 (-) Transcript_24770:354-1010(-)
MKLCFMQDIFGHDFCCVAQCRYLHIVHGREIKNIDDTLKNKICCRGPRAAHERDHITNEIVQSRHDLAFCFYVSTVLLSVCLSALKSKRPAQNRLRVINQYITHGSYTARPQALTSPPVNVLTASCGPAWCQTLYAAQASARRMENVNKHAHIHANPSHTHVYTHRIPKLEHGCVSVFLWDTRLRKMLLLASRGDALVQVCGIITSESHFASPRTLIS